MQCPRCGLYNEPGVSACGRCGLAAPGYAPPAGPPAYPSTGSHPSTVPPGGGQRRTRREPGGGAAALAALVVGAALALAYAGWAFTARRGIFADFSAGTPVSRDDARASDTVDTVFLISAGAMVAAGLVVWIARLVGKRDAGGPGGISGLVVSVLGLLTVAVGLALAGRIADGDGRTEQGDRGITAAMALGAGFALLAVGLLLGALAAGGAASPATPASRPPGGAGPGW